MPRTKGMICKGTAIEHCLVCGAEIKIQKSRRGRKFFCSKPCHHEFMRNGAWIDCAACGKPFWLRQSNIDSGVTTCSPECAMNNRANKIKVVGLDAMWAQVIKHRAGYKCEYCGGTKRPNAHHIYSRGVWSTRWDLDNGICLCVKHHILGAISAHKSPLLFADFVREQRGPIWNERLLDKVKNGKPPNKQFHYFNMRRLLDIFENMDEGSCHDIGDWDWDDISLVDLI